MGGVAGVEVLGHGQNFQCADVRRQVGVERLHHLFRRDLASIAETKRETPRMNAGIGAGAALYIGAAAQHPLHGVLHSGADGRRIGLHLKPAVIRAFIGDP